MNFLHYIWSFLLALAVLIAVHEYGHYLAARLCGIKVLRFSLGFGRTLVARKWGRDQTEWAIGMFPLGGYVKMLDESEGPVPENERYRAFNTQPLWKRAIVVTAGPVANLLLAILLYCCLFMAGSRELLPVLGAVTPGSSAERAGLVAGETIRRIGGETVESWADIRWIIVDRGVDRDTVEVVSAAPNGGIRRSMLDLSSIVIDDRAPDPLHQIGLNMPTPDLPPVLDAVTPGSAGARAGLRAGDRIVGVNGAAVSQFREFADAVAKHPAQNIDLEVKRGEQLLTLHATPEAVGQGESRRGRLGVAARQDPDALLQDTTIVRYAPIEALWRASVLTWHTTTFSLKVMAKMLSGQVSVRNISGPVTIADYAGQTAAAGLDAYLRFLALISISLGVLNLLPVPVLDGGHLLYYAIEAIRGKPLSERVLELGQRAGVAVLASLMLIAFFNDINRVVFG
ncbi:MAG TPA: RIP metalloprotease RseP [Rhodocyclaceae bacterium]|nr:RIP metalloprotease RseP [Rhodocyclaceae bacterium]